MKKLSTTYIGAVVAVIGLVLPIFGFGIGDSGTLTQTLTELAGVAGVLYTFYGRYRAGGISAFGLKKEA